MKGVGTIIGGTLLRGKITVGDTLYLGPDRSGVFIAVAVRSIECRRTAFTEIKTGQSATICVKAMNRRVTLKKSYFKKGMVLISEVEGLSKGSDQTPLSIREFDASVVILHHSTMISSGYQPVIHCGVLRQAAQIISIQGTEALKTGEHAIVRFRFLYFAEYLLPGSTFLFREGRAKGVGKVVQTYPGRELHHTPADHRAGAPVLAPSSAPARGVSAGSR